MRWLDKRYNSLNYQLRTVFGEKTFKLSLDGGFTCPNRDGTISTKGCIFCGEKGSGEYAGNRIDSISIQMNNQKSLLAEKWSKGKYIAYFQNFTNTYSTVEDLNNKYEEALKYKNVVGLAIGTRADCLDDEIIDLLSTISKKTYLWLEIGLQTTHDKSVDFIRRGYKFKIFKDVLQKLRANNINVVVHLIFGIPGESKDDVLNTIKTISNMDIQGVKIHLLHVLKDSDLYDYYLKSNFKLLTKDEYINLVCDAIELLNPKITIHRLTGDGSKDTLIAPNWSLNKRDILNQIDKELRQRDSYQGKYFNP